MRAAERKAARLNSAAGTGRGPAGGETDGGRFMKYGNHERDTRSLGFPHAAPPRTFSERRRTLAPHARARAHESPRSPGVSVCRSIAPARMAFELSTQRGIYERRGDRRPSA